jgi:hypothetical protein
MYVCLSVSVRQSEISYYSLVSFGISLDFRGVIWIESKIVGVVVIVLVAGVGSIRVRGVQGVVRGAAGGKDKDASTPEGPYKRELISDHQSDRTDCWDENKRKLMNP